MTNEKGNVGVSFTKFTTTDLCETPQGNLNLVSRLSFVFQKGLFSSVFANTVPILLDTTGA